VHQTDQPKFIVKSVLRMGPRPGPSLVGRLITGSVRLGDELLSVSDPNVALRVVAVGMLHVLDPSNPNSIELYVEPDLGDEILAGPEFWVRSRMTDGTNFALYELSEAEAFDAMREFLSLHEGHEDSALDLVILTLRDPGEVPTDAAVWIDWLMCVRKVKGLEATEEAALQDAVSSGGWIGRGAAVRLAELRARSHVTSTDAD
jgi:hypothetical protein